MKRRLFVALDKQGNRVNIDSLKDKSLTLACPHCNQPVIPKQGEKNIWHFAHKGELCAALLNSRDDGNNQTLKLETLPTKNLDELDIGSDSNSFLCVRCKRRYAKLSGRKWKDNEYICQECFLNL